MFKRVALYVRVSTEEQALHGYSIEAQKADLIKYAKDHNMIVVDIFVDEGISARKKYNKRKEFLRLLDGVNNGDFELILFTKLDRWFRNIAEYYKVQEILEKNKVNWKTIYEDYDTSTSSGRLHINIMLSVAQDEADRTSERIRSVFHNKVLNKEIVTGKQPYAYDIIDKKIVVNEEKAAIIKDIFDRYFICNSVYSTQKYINAKYNLNFGYDFFSDTLKTEKYTGMFRGVPDYYPAIISKEIFDSCQRNRKSFVRENQTKRVYLFSGLVFCKECGRRMNAMQQVSTANKVMAYRCKYAASMHICPHRLSIREDKIENYLLDNIESQYRDYLLDISKQKAVFQKPKYDKATIKKKLKKLKELYINDLIDMDDYKRDYAEFTKQLELCEEEIIENKNSESVKEILTKSKMDLYKKLNTENKRAFWSQVLKQIIVDNEGNIKVVF